MKIHDAFENQEPVPPGAKVILDAMAVALTEEERAQIKIRIVSHNRVDLDGPEDLKLKIVNAAFGGK